MTKLKYIQRIKSLVFRVLILIFTAGFSLNNFAQNYPFPQTVNYKYGLMPNSKSREEMNTNLQAKFEKWRSVFLTSEGCPTGTKRIDAINQNHETYSEGISYGLTILVYMDNDINDTKADFDAVFGYYKNYLNEKGLMKWKISADGTAVDNGFAGDGDEEVAFALLMADVQWGSNGMINYYQEALSIIDKLKLHNVQPDYTFADGSGGWIFPAYQIPYQWKLFADISGDDDWHKVIARGYSVLNMFYTNSTGLMYDTSTPQGFAVDKNHAQYGYDACRVPWRIGVDYLWNGIANDSLAKKHPEKIAQWAKIKWEGKPSKARMKYKLDGTDIANYCDYGAMVGPMMVGAMTGNDQEWLNTLYDFTSNISIGANYFADHVCILSLLAATANMPNLLDMDNLTNPTHITPNTNPVKEKLIYPNPADMYLLIPGIKENSIIKVVDLKGTTVTKVKVNGNSLEIDVQNWKKGYYVVSIENGNDVTMQTVVVN